MAPATTSTSPSQSPQPAAAPPTPRAHRKRSQSFFSGFGASRSTAWLHEPDEPVPALPPLARPSSRSSTRTFMSPKSPSLTGQAWTLLGGGARPKSAHGASPYGRDRPPGSMPDLPSAATHKANRLSRFLGGGGTVEPKAERPPAPALATAAATSTSTTPPAHHHHHHHTHTQTPDTADIPALPPLTPEHLALHQQQPLPPAPSHRPAQSEPAALLSAARSSPASPEPVTHKQQKSAGRRIVGALARTKSLHRRDGQMNPPASVPSTPTRIIARPGHNLNGTPLVNNAAGDVARSLPVVKESSLKTSLQSASARARSEDRAGNDKEPEKLTKTKKDKKDKKAEDKASKESMAKAQSSKSNGSSFFASHKASEGFGITKAGRGFFNKLTRSTSSNEKVGMGIEEEYEPRLLKLPLVQQTRETRIAKSYDNCRDKTEFWMPALPWRCIDYLNGKCEEEGLYRVSGGLTMVRRWRKRFDLERDVNLLDEPDLYDASVIASLFKEWIRELPEEIFPKARQAKVAATLPTDAPGKKPVPQSLRDELSNLPPFNYYLLFAITCHLSLLLSHEPKNKMTLDNLYRCFNQSLKLDGRIFYTLVGDWRQCWQGCYTENEFLRKEYEFLNTPFPEYPELERRPPQESIADERAVTSSSGSTASETANSALEVQRPATAETPPPQSTEGLEAEPAAPSPLTAAPRVSTDVDSKPAGKQAAAEAA